MTGLRLVVAVSPPLLRDLLTHVLEEHGHAVVAAGDRVDAVLGAADVDVAVLHLRAGTDPSTSLVPFLVRGVRVLAVATTAGVDLTPALLAGATGGLSLAEVGVSTLLRAVRTVAEGEASLNPAVAMAILEQWRDLRRTTPAPVEAELTAREMQVLQGLARGSTTKQLARDGGISEKTVEAHKTRLFGKLGVKNQTQAVAVALRSGLLAPQGEAG